MSYKTILVHVDEARNADARIGLAARLAISEDAHLIGTALTGITRFLYETVATEAGTAGIEPYLEQMRQRADKLLLHFQEVVQRAGVASFEQRRADDEAGIALSLQARYCDLVILGQYDPEGAAPPTYSGLPEYVAMNGGCPVLMIPSTATAASCGERALIAWNGSIEAIRTVRSAIPLLRHASVVQAIRFNPESQDDTYGEQTDGDIGVYLARHGIKADVMEEKVTGDIGAALLSLASSLNSDLLVMGCYGHSRFREIMLGGATRTILASTPVPVFMSH